MWRAYWAVKVIRFLGWVFSFRLLSVCVVIYARRKCSPPIKTKRIFISKYHWNKNEAFVRQIMDIALWTLSCELYPVNSIAISITVTILQSCKIIHWKVVVFTRICYICISKYLKKGHNSVRKGRIHSLHAKLLNIGDNSRRFQDRPLKTVWGVVFTRIC